MNGVILQLSAQVCPNCILCGTNVQYNLVYCLVTIEDVNQEQLPAISICIPTSMKGPGIVKAMGQTYPKIKQDFILDSSGHSLHQHWKNAIYTYLDKIMGFNNNHIERQIHLC